MPLTIAHPVAVLPLRRCGIPLSALVAGSMSPDVEYILRLSPVSNVSHTIAGLFLFCLPAGLVALWIFHRIWKRPLASVFSAERRPAQDHQNLAFRFWPMGRFGILCIGVLLGALTHLVWDSFTHEYGWMVQHVPALSTTVLQTSSVAVPLFKVLQHGSTVFGLTVLIVVALRHPGWRRPASSAAWALVILVCCTSAAGGLVIGLARVGQVVDLYGLHRLVVISVISCLALAVVEITAFSLAWHVRRRKSEPADAGDASRHA